MTILDGKSYRKTCFIPGKEVSGGATQLCSASSVSSPTSNEPSWEIRFLYRDFLFLTEMEDIISSLRLGCRLLSHLVLDLPQNFLLEKTRLKWWQKLSNNGSRFAPAGGGARITNRG